LTCPDGNSYYKWQGKTTSAQYYINPKGVSAEEGCQWGDGKRPIGNWAPLNMGCGENNGKWLSIFQNAPTTYEPLDFNVKIVGSNLSGSCKYENGVFYSETGPTASGCTVSSSRPTMLRIVDLHTVSNRFKSCLAMPPLYSTRV
jgi:hypothetical protein